MIAGYRLRRTWSNHVVVLQRAVKKYPKIYNARAQLLYFSLSLLFVDVLGAVVMVCLSSLMIDRREREPVNL